MMNRILDGGMSADIRVALAIEGDGAECIGLYLMVAGVPFPLTTDEFMGPPASRADVRLAASAFSRITGADREEVEGAMMQACRGDNRPLTRLLVRHANYLGGLGDSDLLSYLAMIEAGHVVKRSRRTA